jgi:hypothetical protein
MDDVLDELINEANDELHEFLDRVIEVQRNSPVVTRQQRILDVNNLSPVPVFGLKVSYSVKDLIDLAIRLVSQLSVSRHSIRTLHELRDGLAERQLSRGAAEELIASVVLAVRSHDRWSDLSCSEAKQALDVLASLRQAVERLFDDADDTSMRCPTR